MSRTVQHEQKVLILSKEPDVCPICFHAMTPGFLIYSIRGTDSSDADWRADFIYKCPRLICGHVFIARCVPSWPPNPHPHQMPDKQFRQQQRQIPLQIETVVPKEYRKPIVPTEIDEISPSFRTIYEQASAAEAFGLSEIAGVGLRKSLEFLIKDYAIKNLPDKSSEIQSKLLGACIDQYVDDGNIKACAKRAAWLGNDETHYVRKWQDKDILDLKILIELTVGWIKSNVLTKKYLAEMP